MYYVNMNRNIYNYKWVNEQVLPLINRDQFAHDFAIAIEQKQFLVKDVLGNDLNQIITDVIYYKDTFRSYKNIPNQKYQRLWNAFCFTYWSNDELAKSIIDEWGYIKWKDIGYEPTQITSAKDAYLNSMHKSQSEPQY